MPDFPIGGIKVHNARELRRAIKQAENSGLRKELRAAYKTSANVVSRTGAVNAPVLTGDLRDSVRPLGSQSKAVVAVGRGRTRDYAGVTHYGNPHRGIEPQEFIHDALSEEWPNVVNAFDDALSNLAEKLSTSRF